jgi:hypothetical protein
LRCAPAEIPAANLFPVIGACRTKRAAPQNQPVRNPRRWNAACLSFVESEMFMLRISFSDSAGDQRWSLCGRLAGPWVNELRACWQYAQNQASRSHSVMDLRDVTFVDADGEQLLSEMRGAGVEFVASGVEMKHLLENLNTNNERNHE